MKKHYLTIPIKCIYYMKEISNQNEFYKNIISLISLLSSFECFLQMQLSADLSITILRNNTDEPEVMKDYSKNCLYIKCRLSQLPSQQAIKCFQAAWKYIGSRQLKDVSINIMNNTGKKHEKSEIIQKFAKNAVIEIQKFKSITLLQFSGTLQEDIIFPSLQLNEYKFLKRLRLTSNNLTEKTILSLSKINFNCLKMLDITQNPIRNRGVKYLSKIHFPQLQELHLGQNDFSWEGLKYLSKMMTPQILVYLDCKGKFDCGILGVMMRSRISKFNFSQQRANVFHAVYYGKTGVDMKQLQKFIQQDFSKEDEADKKMNLKLMGVIGLRKFRK